MGFLSVNPVLFTRTRYVKGPFTLSFKKKNGRFGSMINGAAECAELFYAQKGLDRKALHRNSSFDYQK